MALRKSKAKEKKKKCNPLLGNPYFLTENRKIKKMSICDFILKIHFI